MLLAALPIPSGMTADEAENLPFSDSRWKELKMYVCRICRRPAHENPFFPRIWSCIHCRFQTLDHGSNFMGRFI
jgi:hypothetical protein